MSKEKMHSKSLGWICEVSLNRWISVRYILSVREQRNLEKSKVIFLKILEGYTIIIPRNFPGLALPDRFALPPADGAGAAPKGTI
jgi:hypothetical protein